MRPHNALKRDRSLIVLPVLGTFFGAVTTRIDALNARIDTAIDALGDLRQDVVRHTHH